MEAIAADDVTAADAASAPVSEDTVAAVQRYSLRGNTLNFLRFASVLVGAGLLLRVGASEQASSAIDDEKAPAEKPLAKRIALPQPTFGNQAERAERPAIVKASATLPAASVKIAKAAQEPGKAQSVRPQAPTPAFAATFGPSDTTTIAESATAPAPSLIADTQSDTTPRAPMGAAPSMLPQNQDATVVAVSNVAPPAASALAAKPGLAPRAKAAAKPGAASKPAQAISLASRPTAAEGLLAPVRITSPIGGAVLASAPATPARGSMRPVSAGLANAQPRTAPLAPAAANPVASAVIPQPAQISLATPVMTRGPRTTVLTSKIADVMRRPASAWDYAEALSPEMSGAARRTASVPASPAMPPAETSASPTALPAAPRQMIAVEVPRDSAKAQAVAVARSQAEPAPTAPRRAAAAVEPAAPASAKVALARPQTEVAQKPIHRSAQAERPIASASGEHVALLAPAAADPRTGSARPLRTSSFKALLPDEKRQDAERQADRPSALQSDIDAQSGSGLTAGGPADDGMTLSLLDRMPRPAF